MYGTLIALIKLGSNIVGYIIYRNSYKKYEELTTFEVIKLLKTERINNLKLEDDKIVVTNEDKYSVKDILGTLKNNGLGRLVITAAYSDNTYEITEIEPIFNSETISKTRLNIEEIKSNYFAGYEFCNFNFTLDENSNISKTDEFEEITVEATTESINENMMITMSLSSELKIDSDGLISLDRDNITEYTDLETLVIPNGIKGVKSGGFKGAPYKYIIFDKGETCEIINPTAFEGCTNLEQVMLSDGIKVIRRFAFKRCTSLTRIEFPDGIKNIEYGAFKDCNNLKEVVFGQMTNVNEVASMDTFNGAKITIRRNA